MEIRTERKVIEFKTVADLQVILDQFDKGGWIASFILEALGVVIFEREIDIIL